MILQSSAYQNNGLVLITWDEGVNGDGPIGMIVLSPLAKGGGYHNATFYTHSSTLRTLQKIFNVRPLLNGASTAQDLSDLFVSNAIPNADAEIAITSLSRTANTVSITWQSQPGLAYRVQWKDNVTDQSWFSVTPDQTGTGGILSWTDDGTQTGSAPSTHRYYRVVRSVDGGARSVSAASVRGPSWRFSKMFGVGSLKRSVLTIWRLRLGPSVLAPTSELDPGPLDR